MGSRPIWKKETKCGDDEKYGNSKRIVNAQWSKIQNQTCNESEVLLAELASDKKVKKVPIITDYAYIDFTCVTHLVWIYLWMNLYLRI